jgi:amidase
MGADAMKDYSAHDGLGLAALVRDGKVKAEALVEAAVERLEALNPKLNAVIYKTYDHARTRAKLFSAQPFAGVPFLLKDIGAAQKGVPTRQGSGFLPDAPSPHDSYLTEKFEAAGLLSLGKTNVPEFGLVPITESTLYGPARNPWNVNHTPGGSSGGSAAAVAAGIVPLAHANDGGGSIRIPAASCGLVGLKPTRGRISLGPDLGEISGGLVNEGVVSRTVRDTAAALDATAGYMPGDPHIAPLPPVSYLTAISEKPGRLRIGFATKDLAGAPFHPDCQAAVQHAAKLAEAQGHRVEEASPPVDIAVLSQAFMPIWASGVAMLVDGMAMLTGKEPRQQDFQGLSWATYQAGKTITAAQYQMCWFQLQAMTRGIAQWHQSCDMWLTPTLGGPPAKISQFNMQETDMEKAWAPIIDYVPFTALQNATGQPAINLPLYWNADNLPIGVQFVGRFGEEHLLLSLAGQLEKADPWIARKPQVWM